MNTKIILSVAVVLVVVVAAVVFLGRSGQSLYQSPSAPTVNQSQPTGQPTQSESSTPAGSTTQKTVGVTLTSSGFEPQSVTVKVGLKVVWANNSGTTATVNSADHPTHLVYPPLNLGNFGKGETLSLVFDQPGAYKYHNHLDASQTGVVVVEE